MNTPQDHELAEKISKLLDHGTQTLDPKIAARLLDARKEALAHFQKKPAHDWVPAWATATAGRIAAPFGHNLRASFVLVTLFASLAAWGIWQSLSPQTNEMAEIDVALLTDELPINAYLDKRLDTWLKRP